MDWKKFFKAKKKKTILHTYYTKESLKKKKRNVSVFALSLRDNIRKLSIIEREVSGLNPTRVYARIRVLIRVRDIHRPARAIISSGVLINLILPMKYDNNNL